MLIGTGPLSEWLPDALSLALADVAEREAERSPAVWEAVRRIQATPGWVPRWDRPGNHGGKTTKRR